MHKLVYASFKAIFLSMMFIFLFDMTFYLFRAFSINQRMETIMTSMQKVVMDNNYLPEGEYIMYRKMFEQLAHDMNRGDTFITGMGTNFNRPADGPTMDYFRTHQDLATGSYSDRLRFQTNKPAEYGDVMVVQTKVQIAQPIWGFSSADMVDPNTEYTAAVPNYAGQDSTYWHRLGYRRTTIYYNYYVPCLKFQKIHSTVGP